MTLRPPGGDPGSDDAAILLRVQKGSPLPEELAALTAVLLTWAALPAVEPETERCAPVGWQRPERGQGFSAPNSWQR